MTNQEIFDKVWNYFITESHHPGWDGEACTYYAKDGAARCAVGCLLPDELAKALPSRKVTYIIAPLPGERKSFGEAAADFRAFMFGEESRDLPEDKLDELARGATGQLLSDLQRAHDNAATLDNGNFRELLQVSLVRVAERFNLKIPVAA